MIYSKLLISEEPLQVLPSLATEIGLNEAIVLQQLHYWLNPKRNVGEVHDGRRWVYNTYAQWKENFPFWSVDTIKRTILKLEKDGLIESTDEYNKDVRDRTKWYTVNYDHAILHDDEGNMPPSMSTQDCPPEQGNMPHSTIRQRIPTETTTETTSLPTIDDAFESWYSRYPRKEGKKNALKAWMVACQKTRGVQPLFDALVAQINNNWHGRERQYIPLPASWLNGERWKDEIVPPKTNGNGQRPAPRYYEKDGSYTAEGALARMRGEIE